MTWHLKKSHKISWLKQIQLLKTFSSPVDPNFTLLKYFHQRHVAAVWPVDLNWGLCDTTVRPAGGVTDEGKRDIGDYEGGKSQNLLLKFKKIVMNDLFFVGI